MNFTFTTYKSLYIAKRDVISINNPSSYFLKLLHCTR